jgi:peptidoglycan-associated lipoprotein
MFNVCYRFILLLLPLMPLLFLSSCCRSKQDVWDNTRSCSRHMMRGLRSLGGDPGDSRQVRNRHDFMPSDDDGDVSIQHARPQYAPLPEAYCEDELAWSEYTPRVPRATTKVAATPVLENYQDTALPSSGYSTFANINFPYNSELIKGSANIATVRKLATYLKSHPKAYAVIEGHCDERGAEAYNLALGLRRAHSVRSMLAQENVRNEQLQTVSFGKERPLDLGHTEDAWSRNRRAAFKIYER